MDNTIAEKRPPRTFSLEDFKKNTESMIAKNNVTYGTRLSAWERLRRERDFTPEQVDAIIQNGEPVSQSELSRNFFYKDGFYREIIMHYATLLTNMGILIPNPAFGTSLQDNPIAKRVHGATNFVEQMKLKTLLTKISIAVLVDGTYYGIIGRLSKNDFTLLDLPFKYCRSYYVDELGQDLIEFNVDYFNSIADKKERRLVLSTYPENVARYYESWVSSDLKKRPPTPWMFLPSDIAVSFQLLDARPYFLPLLPVIFQYDEAVKNEAEKQAEELKKILVIKIPHIASTGELVFEPDEAQVMHNGAVGMLKDSNPNTSVLTTYGEVEAIQSKTTDNIAHTSLEQMSKHLYSNAGVSSEIFNATSSSSLDVSLQYDTSLMMTLSNKYAEFVSRVINQVYGNSQLQFKYNILAITEYNKKDFISDSFKLAQSGYSILIPALAQGLSQRDLINLKTWENSLELNELLIPLQSAYTNSAEAEKENGRPELERKKKSDKTVANEGSKGNAGG